MPPGQRNPCDIALLAHLLQQTTFFASLPPTTLRDCCQQLEKSLYPKDSDIQAEGNFCFILSGQISVLDESSRKRNQFDEINVLHTGEYFGALSLLAGVCEQYHYRCKDVCLIVSLHSTVAKHKLLLNQIFSRRFSYLYQLLKSQPYGEFFSASTLKRLLGTTHLKHYDKNSFIFRSGAENSALYIVVSGQFQMQITLFLIKKKLVSLKNKQIGTIYQTGQLIGQRNWKQHTETVYCTSNDAEVIILRQRVYQNLGLDFLQSYIRKPPDTTSAYEQFLFKTIQNSPVSNAKSSPDLSLFCNKRISDAQRQLKNILFATSKELVVSQRQETTNENETTSFQSPKNSAITSVRIISSNKNIQAQSPIQRAKSICNDSMIFAHNVVANGSKLSKFSKQNLGSINKYSLQVSQNQQQLKTPEHKKQNSSIATEDLVVLARSANQMPIRFFQNKFKQNYELSRNKLRNMELNYIKMKHNEIIAQLTPPLQLIAPQSQIIKFEPNENIQKTNNHKKLFSYTALSKVVGRLRNFKIPYDSFNFVTNENIDDYL